jgi:nucleoside-diphosphate-sugar epimerase
MHVLITGHQGFVGRHFFHYFDQKKECAVTGIDLKAGHDCRDFFRQDEKPAKSWDLVIHLAAVVGGRQLIEGDPIAVATDLSIDAELFNWAVRKKPKKIIYYSSSAAYPVDFQTAESQQKKLVESDIDLEHIQKPDFTYGWAKLTGELLAKYAMENYGLDVTVFRPCLRLW